MGGKIKDMKRETKNCVTCKQVFEMAYGQSYSRWRKQRFCSKQCQGIFNRKTPLVETRKICLQCSSPFERNPRFSMLTWASQRFCSMSCAGMHRKPVKSQPTKECLICGSTFAKPSKQKNSWWDTAKYCTRTCSDIEKAVFMQTVRYRGKENWVWRKAVLERDASKCRMDNTKCSGNLTIHHILRYSEFPELRYDIKNGITLCKFHHPLKRKEEKELAPLFTNLVNQNGD